jgi:autotransporter-associated beta strand protein
MKKIFLFFVIACFFAKTSFADTFTNADPAVYTDPYTDLEFINNVDKTGLADTLYDVKSNIGNSLSLNNSFVISVEGADNSVLTYTDTDIPSVAIDNSGTLRASGLGSKTLKFQSSTNTNVITINNSGTIANLNADENSTNTHVIDLGTNNRASIVINNNGDIARTANSLSSVIIGEVDNQVVINNNAGGTISGTIDLSSNVPAAAVTINNRGTLTSASNGLISIDLASANKFNLNMFTGASVSGAIDNVLAGTGTLQQNINFLGNVSVAEYTNLTSTLSYDDAWKIAIKDDGAGNAGILTIGEGESFSNGASNPHLNKILLEGGTVQINGDLGINISSAASNLGTISFGDNGVFTGTEISSGLWMTITNNSDKEISAVLTGIDNGSHFSKDGVGKLTLSGTNTNIGNFYVDEGELNVFGSLANQDVFVRHNSTLSGNGTIAGNVTVFGLSDNANPKIAPGNSSIGTLNIGQDFTVVSGYGGSYQVDFSSNSADKILVGGDVSLAENLNLSIFGQPNHAFVVSKNIIESLGQVTGAYDSVTGSDEYVYNVDYLTNAVRLTASTKIDESYLDSQIFAHNNTIRLVSDVLEREALYGMSAQKNKDYRLWINYDYFDAEVEGIRKSKAYEDNGHVLSLGFVKTFESFDLVGSVYNARNNVERGYYEGSNDINSFGVALGVGKKFDPRKNMKKKHSYFYNFAQVGYEIYNNKQNRDVLVNGELERGKADFDGEAYYAEIGTHYFIPVFDHSKIGFSTSLNLTQIKQEQINETGLSYGNLVVDENTAETFNVDFGIFFQSRMPSFFHLPRNSFYNFELNAYQSQLIDKKLVSLSQGGAEFALDRQYNQGLLLSPAITLFTEITKSDSIFLKAEKRMGSEVEEFNGSVSYKRLF